MTQNTVLSYILKGLHGTKQKNIIYPSVKKSSLWWVQGTIDTLISDCSLGIQNLKGDFLKDKHML